jgi:hypothetical protein
MNLITVPNEVEVKGEVGIEVIVASGDAWKRAGEYAS